jgi:hypothetical protein
MTPEVNLASGNAGVINTGGKFAMGSNGTGSKFAINVSDTDGK